MVVWISRNSGCYPSLSWKTLCEVRCSKTRCWVRRNEALRRWLIPAGVCQALLTELWTLVGRDRCIRSIFLFSHMWCIKYLQQKRNTKNYKQYFHCTFVFNNEINSLQTNLKDKLDSDNLNTVSGLYLPEEWESWICGGYRSATFLTARGKPLCKHRKGKKEEEVEKKTD